MAFNLSKFQSSKLKYRTAEIAVPQLQAFFDDGEQAIWTVRNLTSKEIGICADAVNLNISEKIKSAANLLLSDEKDERVAAAITGISEAFSNKELPSDVIRRMNYLHLCSINPKIDYTVSVKLAEYFSLQFYELTNKILELTRMGSILGE